MGFPAIDEEYSAENQRRYEILSKYSGKILIENGGLSRKELVWFYPDGRVTIGESTYYVLTFDETEKFIRIDLGITKYRLRPCSSLTIEKK